MRLNRVIITWVSTGPGGAEESSKILAEAIGAHFNLDIDLIIWYYSPLSEMPQSTFSSGRVKSFACYNYKEYLGSLKHSLSQLSPPSGTILFSNQRSFMIDLKVAREYQVKSAIIFRGMADPAIAIQTIPLGHPAQRHYQASDHQAFDATGQIAAGRPDDQPELTPVKLSAFDWESFNSASAVVAISDSAAAALRKMVLVGTRVERIYNGLSDDWLHEPEPPPAALPKNRSGAVNFLIVSRLVKWKSVSVALAAFAQLASSFPAIQLHILGEGPEKGQLTNFVAQAGLKHRIFFEGWIGDPRPWYYNSDCLIHCAPLEGFGRVLAEANACQLIAIAAGSGAGGELILDGVTGFTFEPENIASLKQALKRFLELDESKRLQMSRTARQRAEELFNAKTISTQYIELAQSILDTPPSSS